MRQPKVRFASVDIPATAIQGFPVGQGACRGVRLQLPVFQRNTEVEAQIAAGQRVIYYGDRNGQECELTAILTKENITPFLPCNDLSEIWVRGNGVRNLVQVIIYNTDE